MSQRAPQDELMRYLQAARVTRETAWIAVPRYDRARMIICVLSCGHTLLRSMPPWGTVHCLKCECARTVVNLQHLPPYRPPQPSRGRRW